MGKLIKRCQVTFRAVLAEKDALSSKRSFVLGTVTMASSHGVELL